MTYDYILSEDNNFVGLHDNHNFGTEVKSPFFDHSVTYN